MQWWPLCEELHAMYVYFWKDDLPYEETVKNAVWVWEVVCSWVHVSGTGGHGYGRLRLWAWWEILCGRKQPSKMILVKTDREWYVKKCVYYSNTIKWNDWKFYSVKKYILLRKWKKLLTNDGRREVLMTESTIIVWFWEWPIEEWCDIFNEKKILYWKEKENILYYYYYWYWRYNHY